ncbi:MAG TPA: mycoredoxin [Ktedonobacteraceae bacterium]|nr:mycoredoxin [Ktedonobacteraceae bacterium]
MPDLETPQKEKITTMYVTSWCPYCRNVKRWLDSHGVPFVSINIEENEDAAQFVRSVNGGNQTVPTVVFPDGSVETNPGALYLAKKFPQTISE